MNHTTYFSVQLFLALLLTLYGVGLVYRPFRVVSEGPFRRMLHRNVPWLLVGVLSWFASCSIQVIDFPRDAVAASQAFFLLTSLQLLPIAVLTMGYPNQFLRDSIFAPSRLKTVTDDQWSFRRKDRAVLTVVFAVLLICQLAVWIVPYLLPTEF